MGEPSFTDCRLLVEAFVPHMIPLLDKPFALFGHSMGAIVAFEAARQVRRLSGLQPTPVCLWSTCATDAPQRASHL
jgi:medium-chain acyl-[acyl-carrier-protein] hydrolase